MKTLYIARHAKSSWEHPEVDDIDRPLNKRGLKDAPKIGKYLKGQGIIPDYVVSSPARRAMETAQYIADETGYGDDNIIVNDDIYEAYASELLDIVTDIPNEYSSAFIFGHNPGVSSLAAYLCDKFSRNMTTCNIVGIRFDVNKWKKIDTENAEVVFFVAPKEL